MLQPDAATPELRRNRRSPHVKLVGPTAATRGRPAKVGSTTVSGKVYDAPHAFGDGMGHGRPKRASCKLAHAARAVLRSAVQRRRVRRRRRMPRQPDRAQPRHAARQGHQDHDGRDRVRHRADQQQLHERRGGIAAVSGVCRRRRARASRSSGGDYAPISVTLDGIAPLELEGRRRARAGQADQPLQSKWTTPAHGRAVADRGQARHQPSRR